MRRLRELGGRPFLADAARRRPARTARTPER
jgi:hypothetical protein